MEKLTIKMIKEKYPHPIEGENGVDRESYCVGGAFLASYKGKGIIDLITGFPRTWVLREAIDKYREEMELPVRNDSYELAEQIIVQNDSGNFDAAWEALGKALNGN